MLQRLPPTAPVELVSGGDLLELAIASWLDAKAGRSGSPHTARIYRTGFADFRAALHRTGLELDADPRAVALAAQAWASHGNPAGATYNLRLAVLSSFYLFARKQGLLDRENPIALVERRPEQSYGQATALTPDYVRRQLAAIDRSTLAGQRDYAILSVTLVTGRRVAEIASLRWEHVQAMENGAVKLFFRRTKGGKTMADILPIVVSRALTSYLHTLYGQQLSTLAPDAPIWIAVARNRYGLPLSPHALGVICHQHLHTHFHALRHTFARTMEDTGAKVSEIQGRLGHESLATTGKYLAALRRADNPHGEALAELLGLGE